MIESDEDLLRARFQRLRDEDAAAAPALPGLLGAAGTSRDRAAELVRQAAVALAAIAAAVVAAVAPAPTQNPIAALDFLSTTVDPLLEMPLLDVAALAPDYDPSLEALAEWPEG